MVRITEELLRKRAEHNECEIFSLEELSLHQSDIERIEYLDKWCKDLKILYLQSNLIPKIENLGRLKKVEYINLALNNIERIENLEGCEFLKKLDLTVNFVGELSSVENLVNNNHLREFYLTGNPCTNFTGYRDFVIATLPQLKSLDGIEITKSDQIKALQNYKSVTKQIIEQQEEHCRKRQKQKEDFEEKIKNRGDISAEEYWNEKSEFTPESRIETHKFTESQKKKTVDKKDAIEQEFKKPRKYFSDDGVPFNCNEPKVEFEIKNNDENIELKVYVFKFMDSSLVDVDVQPKYVRVTLKGKVLQLFLEEEIKCGMSTAQRSQITGELLVKMPKQNPITRVSAKKDVNNVQQADTKPVSESKKINPLLEFDNNKKVDYKNIVNDATKKSNVSSKISQKKEPENSADFVDDPDVPPLI